MYGALRIPFAAEDGWLRVRDTEDERNWILLAYAQAEPNQVEIVGEGERGLAECLTHVSDDRVFWGGFRVIAVDSRRGVVSRRPKFVFFMLSGAAAPLKLKARGLLDMGAIAEVLSQAHISFQAESVAELSESAVVNKLLQSGGAHKPNGWDFGGGGGLSLQVEW